MFAAIDLKSFYASVECVKRGLDPLSTNLVVADESRTEKTICLAVTPSLKAQGISGRPRLFEVNEKVFQLNQQRKFLCGGKFSGKSTNDIQLKNDKTLELDFIIAKPRMGLYAETSAKIVDIYCRFVSIQDIHIYSIDEVFIDLEPYLMTYGCSGEELTRKMVAAVFDETGITATAGLGTNLYLAKIAMDILAKKMPPDKNGFRIASLDEMSYRQKLWNHRPLTSFWRIGNGTAKALERLGVFTMGDLARLSLECEDLLYKTFGINAELLIDHAWGFESCKMKDIKNYRPTSTSLSSGQVLKTAYNFDNAKIIVAEMADYLSLDIAQKGLCTNQLTLDISYDTASTKGFSGEIVTDRYGRMMPKGDHGTINFDYTSSTKIIVKSVLNLFEQIANPILLIRKINISANKLKEKSFEQISLFDDFNEVEKEKRIQSALINLRTRYGKNAVLKGIDLLDFATAIERNGQMGGHAK